MSTPSEEPTIHELATRLAELERANACLQAELTNVRAERATATERSGFLMKQHHFSLPFFLFVGLLSLLICVVAVAAPTAEALSGKIREFPLPRASSFPEGITAGPDGNLWFTELTGNQIGRITPAGAISEFALPTADSQPFGITVGPDGNLWFTELRGNQIGRISPTPKHKLAEFAVPTTSSNPADIAAGPDGNLWFTEDFGNNIGQVR